MTNGTAINIHEVPTSHQASSHEDADIDVFANGNVTIRAYGAQVAHLKRDRRGRVVMVTLDGDVEIGLVDEALALMGAVSVDITRAL